MSNSIPSNAAEMREILGRWAEDGTFSPDERTHAETIFSEVGRSNLNVGPFLSGIERAIDSYRTSGEIPEYSATIVSSNLNFSRQQASPNPPQGSAPALNVPPSSSPSLSLSDEALSLIDNLPPEVQLLLSPASWELLTKVPASVRDENFNIAIKRLDSHRHPSITDAQFEAGKNALGNEIIQGMTRTPLPGFDYAQGQKVKSIVEFILTGEGNSYWP